MPIFQFQRSSSLLSVLHDPALAAPHWCCLTVLLMCHWLFAVFLANVSDRENSNDFELCVSSVLTLIMSPVLGAVSVAPNEHLVQWCWVSRKFQITVLTIPQSMYLSSIYLFINSTQAFLKFSFIIMSNSNITELSNFSSPLLFSFPFWGFWILFFLMPKEKGTIFRKWCFMHVLKQISTSSVDVSTAPLGWRNRNWHCFKSSWNFASLELCQFTPWWSGPN